jgi:hypothetical protein
MSGLRRKARERARESYLIYIPRRHKEPIRMCPCCKQEFKPGETGHFMPPSLGEEGFFICK